MMVFNHKIFNVSKIEESLKDNLDLLKPRSVREGKRVSVMKHQINEISKATNRLIKENHMLQEENKLLQETKDDQKETKWFFSGSLNY